LFGYSRGIFYLPFLAIELSNPPPRKVRLAAIGEDLSRLEVQLVLIESDKLVLGNALYSSKVKLYISLKQTLLLAACFRTNRKES
jgi:hypothetical protein